jgi:mono/diheme cytochrome c family protein
VLMPNLGLSQDQVAALVAYLGAPGGATAPAPLTPLPPAGDPARGKALFTGDVDFGSHGPPCLGCHSIDRVGVLGGGVMGPDLTQAFASYGAEGLAAALANIPFPTMEPIYTRHPLTPEEQADLWAFLQAESGQQQANAGLLEGVILALSLGGFAVAMAMAGLLWRRRLRGVRRPLVERTAHSAPEN